jgi:hypothetical protein
MQQGLAKTLESKTSKTGLRLEWASRTGAFDRPWCIRSHYGRSPSSVQDHFLKFQFLLFLLFKSKFPEISHLLPKPCKTKKTHKKSKIKQNNIN